MRPQTHTMAKCLKTFTGLAILTIFVGCAATPKDVIKESFSKGERVLFLAYHDKEDVAFRDSDSDQIKRVVEKFRIRQHEFPRRFNREHYKEEGDETQVVQVGVVLGPYGPVSVYERQRIGFERALRKADFDEDDLAVIEAFGRMRETPYYAILDYKLRIKQQGKFTDEAELLSELNRYLKDEQRRPDK